ncbi:hypothetical protein B1T45_07555 [Mycobacterium kansasii]|nr:hypothetical protein MKAN_21600 [Mycobacterium kansasii ATCC 12478]ARG55735.1 hypothetical protein B1T43_07480 [Mycobacterium kansasii]EUA05447.1 hypothetical protein I547_0911 [Mycobacterium kansasii 824]EUA21139.1 hypothetical protein I545_0467 [Mycobacterium kansasii 662]ARG61177.1 hypothetical protein B1T45_07555 [Mycobacterium kansasii]
MGFGPLISSYRRDVRKDRIKQRLQQAHYFRAAPEHTLWRDRGRSSTCAGRTGMSRNSDWPVTLV